MADIYQEIWNADQDNNGVPAIADTETGDPATGFVKVSTKVGLDRDPDLRVLTAVSIPDAKAKTYALCKKLFNNYALPEPARENDTPEERAERHAFIEAIIDTPPMKVAREYIGAKTGGVMSHERWHNVLMDHWFRRFSHGGDPELSGFEHIVVGEQQGGKVQGYHFWYKYYLDDGFGRDVAGAEVFPGLADDQIVFTGSHMSGEQQLFPESVTIGFKWNAPDYEAKAMRPLFKRKGGFFVGCSVEGLMALGTVRAHVGADAPRTAVIEGARYDMKVYLSGNKRHIRTFYPVFKGGVDPVQPRSDQPDRPPTRPDVVHGGEGDVRILSALVNPAGHDPGLELVTLINVGPAPVAVTGWAVMDRNGHADTLDATLEPGRPHTVQLTGKGAQLANKGGTIRLLDLAGRVAHRVSYSRSQAQAENRTILF